MRKRYRKGHLNALQQYNRTSLLLSLSFIMLLLVLLSSSTFSFFNEHPVFVDATSAASSSPSPYTVLGVSKNSSQDEIKKKYRQLCLKYHPDKNVGMNERERRRCEEKFKSIQHANSLIGNVESKRNYDTMSRLNRRSSSSSRGGFDDPIQQWFHDYASRSSSTSSSSHTNPYTSRPYRRRRRQSFFVNGVDISNLFDFQPSDFGRSSNTGGTNGYYTDNHQVHHPEIPKSVFVEKVTVPLKDLYIGGNRKEFVLSDGLIQRYRAAFRGGIARQIVLQGMFASIPALLRTSWPVSALCFVATCHLSLPRPTRLYFTTEIKKGWKGGTKLKFSGVDPDCDVVFVLKEGKHDRYIRDGDDLITSINISRTKANSGCTVIIDALDDSENPIVVKLRPGEIVHDNQVVKIKGRGWPNRKEGGRGDLLVMVHLISEAKASKRKHNSKRKRRKSEKS